VDRAIPGAQRVNRSLLTFPLVILAISTPRSLPLGLTSQRHTLLNRISTYRLATTCNLHHLGHIRRRHSATRRSSSCSIRAPRTHSRKWLRRSCTYDDSACCGNDADRGSNNIVTLCPYHITHVFSHRCCLNCQMEPQLALPQRSPAMDNERDRHVAFTESTRRRAGYLHVLGPGELGQGEKGNDGAIR
jgi:hypothetical protein